MLLNVAYAYLAEHADATDRIAFPTYIAARLDPDEVTSQLRRTALDEWLDAPMGEQAEGEKALLRYLGA